MRNWSMCQRGQWRKRVGESRNKLRTSSSSRRSASRPQSGPSDQRRGRIASLFSLIGGGGLRRVFVAGRVENDRPPQSVAAEQVGFDALSTRDDVDGGLVRQAIALTRLDLPADLAENQDP